ncbi:MAG: tetratricopeptide repeat protein [Candidatus Acidiferrales bacterium]
MNARQMLGGLSYLFYPWGFLLQFLALVHAVRRRPEYYWYYIIFFGGFLGAAVYIVIEVAPDTRLLGDFFKGFGRRSRIQQLETAIYDNPSAGNYEELGDLQLDQKEYARARESLDKSIAARADSIDAFYRRALCSLALNDHPRAIDDLERVYRHDPRYDHDRAAGLLAHAYAQNGQTEQADILFAQVTQISTLIETHYNYACFLKAQRRGGEAKQVAQANLDRKRGMPRYQQRLERPWFRKFNALLKEVPQGETKPLTPAT